MTPFQRTAGQFLCSQKQDREFAEEGPSGNVRARERHPLYFLWRWETGRCLAYCAVLSPVPRTEGIDPCRLRNVISQLYSYPLPEKKKKKQLELFCGFSKIFVLNNNGEMVVDEIGMNSACQKIYFLKSYM